MKRCVIIGGAPITDYGYIKEYLTPDDFYIYCDSGLYHEDKLYPADLIVGDFDSHPLPARDTEIIKLPCEKDDTDTVFAVKTAAARGYDQFIFCGVIGGRLDHTLCNISILLMLDSMGLEGAILTDNETVRLVGKKPLYINNCRYFSVMCIDGKLEGVTITGAKYPLENATINPDYQYGVSNEVAGEFASVTVGRGRALLIITKTA